MHMDKRPAKRSRQVATVPGVRLPRHLDTLGEAPAIRHDAKERATSVMYRHARFIKSMIKSGTTFASRPIEPRLQQLFHFFTVEQVVDDLFTPGIREGGWRALSASEHIANGRYPLEMFVDVPMIDLAVKTMGTYQIIYSTGGAYVGMSRSESCTTVGRDSQLHHIFAIDDLPPARTQVSGIAAQLVQHFDPMTRNESSSQHYKVEAIDAAWSTIVTYDAAFVPDDLPVQWVVSEKHWDEWEELGGCQWYKEDVQIAMTAFAESLFIDEAGSALQKGGRYKTHADALQLFLEQEVAAGYSGVWDRTRVLTRATNVKIGLEAFQGGVAVDLVTCGRVVSPTSSRLVVSSSCVIDRTFGLSINSTSPAHSPSKHKPSVLLSPTHATNSPPPTMNNTEANSSPSPRRTLSSSTPISLPRPTSIPLYIHDTTLQINYWRPPSSQTPHSSTSSPSCAALILRASALQFSWRWHSMPTLMNARGWNAGSGSSRTGSSRPGFISSRRRPTVERGRSMMRRKQRWIRSRIRGLQRGRLEMSADERNSARVGFGWGWVWIYFRSYRCNNSCVRP